MNFVGCRGGAGMPRASAEYRWWWLQTMPGVTALIEPNGNRCDRHDHHDVRGRSGGHDGLLLSCNATRTRCAGGGIVVPHERSPPAHRERPRSGAGSGGAQRTALPPRRRQPGGRVRRTAQHHRWPGGCRRLVHQRYRLLLRTWSSHRRQRIHCGHRIDVQRCTLQRRRTHPAARRERHDGRRAHVCRCRRMARSRRRRRALAAAPRPAARGHGSGELALGPADDRSEERCCRHGADPRVEGRHAHRAPRPRTAARSDGDAAQCNHRDAHLPRRVRCRGTRPDERLGHHRNRFHPRPGRWCAGALPPGIAVTHERHHRHLATSRRRGHLHGHHGCHQRHLETAAIRVVHQRCHLRASSQRPHAHRRRRLPMRLRLQRHHLRRLEGAREGAGLALVPEEEVEDGAARRTHPDDPRRAARAGRRVRAPQQLRRQVVPS